MEEGDVAEQSATESSPDVVAAEDCDVCDVCGSERVFWRTCKQLCLNCGSILKSCADL